MIPSIAAGVLLAATASATRLTIAPWPGRDFPSASATAVKYRLDVVGKPDASIDLKASGIAPGWLGAFCTTKFCSPAHVEVTLPSSGEATIEFELVRESQDAARNSAATISSSDGAAVRIKP